MLAERRALLRNTRFYQKQSAEAYIEDINEDRVCKLGKSRSLISMGISSRLEMRCSHIASRSRIIIIESREHRASELGHTEGADLQWRKSGGRNEGMGCRGRL